MLAISTQPLVGLRIQLEPLQASHKNELFDSAQDEKIWTYSLEGSTFDKFSRWFDRALNGANQKTQFPFIVRRMADQKIIGSTRFYDVHPEHYRLTIGYTWYIPEVWGTYVNPECKYLLLQYAFEKLNVNRVEFVVDSRNVRSREALKKLGATEEGTLRSHMIVQNGYVRDTVMFSIIQSDWLRIRLELQKRLENA